MDVRYWNDPDWSSFSDQDLAEEFRNEYEKNKEAYKKKEPEFHYIPKKGAGISLSLDDRERVMEVEKPDSFYIDRIRKELSESVPEGYVHRVNTTCLIFLNIYASGFEALQNGRYIKLPMDVVALALSRLRTIQNALTDKAIEMALKESQIPVDIVKGKDLRELREKMMSYESQLEDWDKAVEHMREFSDFCYSAERKVETNLISLKILEDSSPENPFGLERYIKATRYLEKRFNYK